MKFSFFNKKKIQNTTKEEWNTLGNTYATGINEMVAFGEKHGWDKWKGEEPKDERGYLADEVYRLLKEANENGTVEEFRTNYPPAHSPLIKLLQKKSQNIEQLHFINNEKIIFLVGTAYQNRQAYILNENKTIELDSSIRAIGKSKKNNVFAILANNRIATTQGWEGEIIETFILDQTKDIGVTELIPFNDGLKLLLTTSEGIYIISKSHEEMIHPIPDPEDEEWDPYIDMENATLSNDNQFIVVGDQGADHRILNVKGEQIGEIGPQSSYPHYCLFSKDDSQLITNSCHFYNGITIGVDTDTITGLKIEAYEESETYKVIDDGMRVYTGLTTKEYYILGDAYGYIKAFDKEGKCVWRHFLGSTISSLTISDDEKTLWVGSCSGMIHKLRLGKGHRDNHTIGDGNHFEEFRLILWKEEPILMW
ncbi:hypothetical protein [Aquimarina sediminis]|uniref:hypothetical protein n=1 Tax=Aquimarina sediminis TaxID=2070536 RepID=UPI000CA042EC|nr:hypothetical protein [Aquimarina sediminis]